MDKESAMDTMWTNLPFINLSIYEECENIVTPEKGLGSPKGESGVFCGICRPNRAQRATYCLVVVVALAHQQLKRQNTQICRGFS